ncbi:MAG: ferrous iron transport protein A [Acidobacteriia bacterium]|nr:ferrous iron transport protein A [Terriglobia bacterium]
MQWQLSCKNVSGEFLMLLDRLKGRVFSVTSEDSFGEDSRSLDHAPKGKQVEVVQIEENRDTRRQLAQLGIQPGTVLCVRQSAPLGGPLLIETQGAVLALGRALSRKIQVRLLP